MNANMTIEQVIENERIEREAFEAKTVGANVGGQDYTIAELRKVFDAVADPKNWKTEWSAAVPHQVVGVVMAAVEFFHADRPVVVAIQRITGKVLMRGNGYQA